MNLLQMKKLKSLDYLKTKILSEIGLLLTNLFFRSLFLNSTSDEEINTIEGRKKKINSLIKKGIKKFK